MRHLISDRVGTKIHKLTALVCVIETVAALACTSRAAVRRQTIRAEPILEECQIRGNRIYKSGEFGETAIIPETLRPIDQRCSGNRAFILTANMLYTLPFEHPLQTRAQLLEEPTTMSDIDDIRKRGIVSWTATSRGACFITRDSQLFTISITGGRNRQFNLRADLSAANIRSCMDQALCIDNAADRGTQGRIVLGFRNDQVQSYTFYPQ
ncbi:hypothetical protein HY990_06980 [Candidatus Micrarchaeota archaeon]|nr:hypothetical protein [Candidatus Micrarchaeota archaeon]